MTLGILLTIISFAWWGLAFLAAKHDKDGIMIEAVVLSLASFAGALTAFFK